MSVLFSDLDNWVREFGGDLVGALDIRSVNDRVDALTLICRDVLSSSSLCYIGGDLHCFNGRYYEPVSRTHVLAVLGNVLISAGVSPTDVRKIGDMPLSVLLGKSHDRSPFLVCFSNCVLSLGCGSEAPLCREFHVSVPVVEYHPYPYDSSASCPLWDSFLSEVLPDVSERMVLQEFFGMCYLDRSFLSVEKFAIFVGGGANGKSVIFEVMKRVFGESNVSTLDTHQLSDGRMLPYVKGARLNFSPDLAVQKGFGSALKALASGQDVTGRRIYGDAEKVKCPPLCFALNEMPQFHDVTPAFFRRLLVFGFDVRIPPERQDRGLVGKICSRDLPGIFNWVLEGRRRLLTNGGAFTPCPRMDEALERLRGEAVALSSPVRACLERMGYGTEPSFDGQVPVRLPFRDLAALLPSLSASSISRAMKRMGVAVGRSRDTYYLVYERR